MCAQKVLGALGASRVSAYVTHGVFPNNSWERFQCDNGGERPRRGPTDTGGQPPGCPLAWTGFSLATFSLAVCLSGGIPIECPGAAAHVASLLNAALLFPAHVLADCGVARR